MGISSEKYNIKTFKPRRGCIKQGYFVPLNKEKYIGDTHEIIYRSSWELRFLRFCDDNPRVLKYESEPLAIPYYDTVAKKVRKYWIDFYVELLDMEGKLNRWLIEVKPKKFLFAPKYPKRETEQTLRRFKSDYIRYINNKMKFEAAENFAKEHGILFGRITEDFLFNKIMR